MSSRPVVPLALALLMVGVTACAPARTPTSAPPSGPGPSASPTPVPAGTTIAQLTLRPVLTASFTATPSATPEAAGSNLGRIAFVSFDSAGAGVYGTYLMNADGSNKTRLRESSHPVRDLAWSPDGAQIAFVEEAPPFGEEIYVMNAIGSGLTRLTSNESQDLHPAWSPDGAKIAFTYHRAGDDFGSIYIMEADGKTQARLAAGACCPAWSPDGTRIAFVRELPNSEVAVINLDDGRLTVLTDNDYRESFPAWSPDGARIAFTAFPEGLPVIHIMDADGSNQSTLTDGQDPAWSPDGTAIAFGYGEEVYAINVDGSGLTKLTDSARVDSGGAVYAFNGYPAWSPIIQHADCTSGWSRLTAGRQARVSEATPDPNRVRSGPSRDDEVIALLDPGTALKLLEGPVCADGLVFWKVQADPIPGGVGWTAEGDAHEYWLEPQAP